MSVKENEKYHILLVEDNNALLSGMADLLEMSGYQVSRASNGQDAFDLMSSLTTQPNLIVSDIRMPGMDGYELLDAVRKRPDWISIPFIFLTAKGEKEDIRDGKLRGVDDYLTKPFEFQDLLVSIQSCLKRHQELEAFQESQIETLRRRILTLLHHEFRTPLSLIVAYADLMAQSETFEHSEQLHQYVNGILDGSERLSRLIESFLLLAELESGQSQRFLNRRKATINDLEILVDEVINNLEARAVKMNVSIQVSLKSPLPTIEGERNYIEIALRHLIDNAIKFSPEGGQVLVSLGADENNENLTIAVSDKGMGIPPAKQALLFEKFQQIDRQQHEQQGAGVGLSIVQHVAELHGGHVELDSQVGEGSCFRLVLPIAHSGQYG